MNSFAKSSSFASVSIPLPIKWKTVSHRRTKSNVQSLDGVDKSSVQVTV